MKNPAVQRMAVYARAERPGNFHSSRTAPTAPSIENRHVRAPRPPKTRSVSHPLNSIPTTPDSSNAATIHPACDSFTPLDSLRSVGPQSSTAYRTA
jgi:hypothetical protein